MTKKIIKHIIERKEIISTNTWEFAVFTEENKISLQIDCFRNLKLVISINPETDKTTGDHFSFRIKFSLFCGILDSVLIADEVYKKNLPDNVPTQGTGAISEVSRLYKLH